MDLLLNAIVAGLLLGGFYAAVTVGISISFGMLDIVNIAHPAFIMMGSFAAYLFAKWTGVDPLLTILAIAPLFFVLGVGLYRLYYVAFESRGQESLRGLAFFFGILFIVEVGLLLVFGVDYRFVTGPYIGASIPLGPVSLPWRMLVPFIGSMLMVGGLMLVLGNSFLGRAILAVAQDRLALNLMGAKPERIKAVAFGISIATAAVAGVFLIIIQPVEPSVGRDYIGRVFAICVMGGMGSIPGTVVAALVLGTAESVTSTFFGPSWAPAVSFTLLLLTLAWRPAGLMGR